MLLNIDAVRSGSPEEQSIKRSELKKESETVVY